MTNSVRSQLVIWAVARTLGKTMTKKWLVKQIAAATELKKMRFEAAIELLVDDSDQEDIYETIYESTTSGS